MKRLVVLVVVLAALLLAAHAVLAAIPDPGATNTNAQGCSCAWPEQLLSATPCLTQSGAERGSGGCGAYRVTVRVENASVWAEGQVLT